VHTAGRLMTNEFFAFDQSDTVGKATVFIRDNPGIELTRWIFVMGDDHQLLGYVPDRNILINDPNVTLIRLLRPVLHTVSPEASRDEVVELFERYQLPVLPVVDPEERLLGVITPEDVVEAMEDIADDTIANIGGTVEALSEDEPSWKRFFARAPWLVVTLLAGLVTASGIAFFHDEPWFLIVPLFIPLITGMSGNVGIQCSTILVRSMATGEVSSGTRKAVIFRELKLGFLIGLTFGALCGLGVYLLNHFGVHIFDEDPLQVGFIVSSGLLGACFTATVLGTLSPFFFARLRIDPAIASGPIVTACNDVLSTYMYFLVAYLVARFFELPL
jgi:magnesium transporter